VTFSVESSTRRYSRPTLSEDLSGKWQAAILKAEQNRPKLRGYQRLVLATDAVAVAIEAVRVGAVDVHGL